MMQLKPKALCLAHSRTSVIIRSFSFLTYLSIHFLSLVSSPAFVGSGFIIDWFPFLDFRIWNTSWAIQIPFPCLLCASNKQGCGLWCDYRAADTELEGG